MTIDSLNDEQMKGLSTIQFQIIEFLGSNQKKSGVSHGFSPETGWKFLVNKKAEAMLGNMSRNLAVFLEGGESINPGPYANLPTFGLRLW